MTTEYRTLLKYASYEEEIKKSRFIAYVKPVETEEEAVEFVGDVKKRHKDAAHNVPVYVLGTRQEIQRYSDDGEPGGTAGVAILDMVKKEGLTNLAVVVTRYFGGVKLGTGGLVRAYTQVVQKAFSEAEIVNKCLYVLLSARMDYSMHGKVQNFLYGSDFILKETKFDDMVSLFIYCPLEDEEAFVENINNMTNGKAVLERREQGYHIVKDGKFIDKQEV